ncbi:short-chain specific acyl-CoA dehydrogenase, mitochondrial-like [Anopheles ziemanni]|uniref:short-chain specific acyl-CoA dehydrogenase, mitochondrial-like n=1 Tax=Anopheles coustani TaxID=139045 RepID=UPI002658A657|nr:short-chain specific acyl-CoA dehydrogenase, mitochondrial-like [Anopheles coustani]XP_058179032.1 short-chain specific acyl-CoA dehydrogenase, mitochondrial-like [Anopheles ziemanni]
MLRKICELSCRRAMSSRQFSVCELSRDHRAIQQLCRRFAENELKPVASEIDRSGTFPEEPIAKLADLGMMRVTVNPQYGGCGLDMLSLSLVVEELSRGCGSTGSIVSIHNCLYANLLDRLGTDEQKGRFFNKYSKKTIGAFALSEADAGSDVAAMTTRATQGSDGCWILNGAKAWVTSGIEAVAGIVFATVDPSLKYKGITAFLVDFDADQLQGLTRGKPEDKLGIRGTSTCDLVLENVRVPETNVLGSVGGGMRIAMEQLDRARIGIASQAIGIGQASLEQAVQYAKHRTAFGGTLIDLPAVRTRIADMATRIETARLLVRKAAGELDRGLRATKSCSMAKWVAGEAATAAAHGCQQIHGGMGYVKSLPAERFYRDARITEIYGGATDVQKSIVADQTIKDLE